MQMTQTDPFTDENVNPNSKRMMNVAIGKRDRDYVASLELSRRLGKNADKKKRRKKIKNETKTTLVAGKSRDKHNPTPKRPKQKKRKSLWKEFIKGENESEEVACSNDNRSGRTIAVCDLGVDSLNIRDTTASSDRGFNEKNHILGELLLS